MLEYLKQEVYYATKELQRKNLINYDYGSVSVIDRTAGIIAIRPKGVRVEDLFADKIVLVSCDNKLIEGDEEAVEQISAHIEFYKAFSGINSIADIRTMGVGAFAQSVKPIPPMGTLHCENFMGTVPVTRPLEDSEIIDGFYKNAALLAIKEFDETTIKTIPAVLIACHGAFCFGENVKKAIQTADVLESVAKLAKETMILTPGIRPLAKALAEERFLKAHKENIINEEKMEEEND